MKQTLLAALLAATLAGCATTPPPAATATPAAAPSNSAALAGMREMKIAFDVTSGDPNHVLLTLIVIEMTHKQLVDAGVTPRIVVAFRGDASYFTTTNLSSVKENGSGRSSGLPNGTRMISRQSSSIGSPWRVTAPTRSGQSRTAARGRSFQRRRTHRVTAPRRQSDRRTSRPPPAAARAGP